MIEFVVPIKTVSEANQRCHWATRHRRFKRQGQAVFGLALAAGLCNVKPPCRITITRIGKRLLDSDNLAGSQKAVRDTIAKAMRVNDGNSRIIWKYDQEIGKEYAVRIRAEGLK